MLASAENRRKKPLFAPIGTQFTDNSQQCRRFDMSMMGELMDPVIRSTVVFALMRMVSVSDALPRRVKNSDCVDTSGVDRLYVYATSNAASQGITTGFQPGVLSPNKSPSIGL